MFRRLRDVPLRVPPRLVLEFPDPEAAHKYPGEIRKATDAALRRVADTRLGSTTAGWVDGLARRLAPYVDGDRPAHLGEHGALEEATRRLGPPLHLSARLGTAFADVEVGLRPIDSDKSDAVVATALGFASFLQTRFGPEHLGFYVWRTTRVGYFLARSGNRVDPADLLPNDADITVVFNEVVPRYASATEAMQLTWDTLIAPHSPQD